MIKRIIPFIGFKTVPDKKFIAALKAITGETPGNISLYKQAFIHSSKSAKSKEALPNNERLEFLGDAILGAIIGDYLFKKYPNKNEGFLTQIRSKIVNRQHLHQLAIKFGLDELLLNKLSGADKAKSSAYGDAFEALIGAFYLDKGFDKTRKFVIEKIVKFHIDVEELVNIESDFKSKFQIYCQKNKLQFSYNVTELINNKTGKIYRVNIIANETEYASFEHYSKKVAEQKAAEIALNQIENG